MDEDQIPWVLNDEARRQAELERSYMLEDAPEPSLPAAPDIPMPAPTDNRPLDDATSQLVRGGNNPAELHQRGQGPYAYAGANEHGGTSGVGLVNSHNSRVDVDLGIHEGSGEYTDPTDGSLHEGNRVHGGLNLDFHISENVDAHLGFLNFEGGRDSSSGGDSGGLQANVFDWAVDLRSNSEEDRPNTNDDERLRFGTSLGAGFGIRRLDSDEDGDGRRSTGWGADLGPLSVDYESETPLLPTEWFLRD